MCYTVLINLVEATKPKPKTDNDDEETIVYDENETNSYPQFHAICD